MMSLLTKRANALKAGKFERAKEIQQQMTKYKNDNFDAITTPRAFYCTFHTEHAYKEAIAKRDFYFIDEDEKQLDSRPIIINQASEATDILWENRHIRKKYRICRWILIVIVMIVLSIGSFTFIFWLLKRKLLVDYSVRPPGIECDTVNRNIKMPFYEQILKQRAYKEAE